MIKLWKNIFIFYNNIFRLKVYNNKNDKEIKDAMAVRIKQYIKDKAFILYQIKKAETVLWKMLKILVEINSLMW